MNPKKQRRIERAIERKLEGLTHSELNEAEYMRRRGEKPNYEKSLRRGNEKDRRRAWEVVNAMAKIGKPYNTHG